MIYTNSDKMRSIEAEQAVLGSMLIDSACIKSVASRLTEDDFSFAMNQQIFRTLVQMDLEGKTVDGLTAAESLKAQRIGEEKANRSYLAQLMDITPTSANVLEYADIVLDRSKRRHLRQALQDGMDQLEADEPEESILPALEKALSAQMERASGDLLFPAQQVDLFYQRRERIDAGQQPYVRTGFRQLDKQLGGGMQNSGLYILAARPNVGKTTLALAIAEWAAQAVGPVLFISLEMDSEQVTAKRIAARAKLNYQDVLSGTLTEEEYRRVSQATVEIGRTPLVVSDRSATVGKIASMARGRKDFRLVVIDHFSLIQTSGRQDRVQEYTAVSNSLKRLAKAIKAPILTLAQLNRANEQRSNKQPILSDLRETGAVEQDADGVIMLHRPDYYDKDARPENALMPVLVDVNVAKNRHGGTGHVSLSFYRQTGIFKESFVK